MDIAPERRRPRWRTPLLAALLAALLCGAADAMPANPAPFTVTQPDGTAVRLRQVGGPGRRLVVDMRGYTCVAAERALGSDDGRAGGDFREGEGRGADRWFMYAALDEDTGALVSSGLRCGIDDPAAGGLPKGVAPKITYGERRQLREGGGATPGFECGEYCHPNRRPRRTDIVQDLVNRGNGGRRLDEEEGRDDEDEQVGGFERDRWSPELPEEQPEALPLESDPDEDYRRAVDILHPHLPKPNRDLVSSEGTQRRLNPKRILKNLVICMKFKDHANRVVPSKADISALMNAKGIHPKAPTGSVAALLSRNSYNSFDLQSTVLDWVTLSKTEAYCADQVSGLGTRMHECIREVLELVKGRVNWKEFDVYENGGAGNKEVDSIAIFHSGFAAEFDVGPEGDCYGQPSHNRIWSHEWSLSRPWFAPGGIMVQFYPINSALWGVGDPDGGCSSEIARVGVVTHEICHFLGLVDLYDTRPDVYGVHGFGIGTFGLMGNAWGRDYSQLYPRLLCPWSRIALGWLTPSFIAQSGTYSLRASYDHPDVKIIKHNCPKKEFFILENMFEEYQEFKGMIIWHIDNLVYDLDYPDNEDLIYNELEGYPGQPGQPKWPANGRHYRVAVLQADGAYELERGYDEGDAYDTFSKCWIDEIGPSQNLGPPFPNTDSYQNGNIKKTGIRIYDIGDPGKTLQFKVDMNGSYEDSQKKMVKVLMPKFAVVTIHEHYKAHGCMFHVFPKKDVTVLGFDIHVDFTNTQQAEIWRLPTNTWLSDDDLQYNPRAWTKLASVSVKGKGMSCRTPVKIPEVPVRAGTIIAFYITFTNGPYMVNTYPDPKYEKMDLSKAKYAEDDDCAITFGPAKKYFGPGLANAKPNVVVLYAKGLEGVPATPAPVAAPTFAPFDSSPQTELATTFQGGNKGAGAMFVFRAKRDIELRTFSVHPATMGNVNVDVYFRKDTYVGHVDNPAAWNRLCSATVKGLGQGVEVKIPEARCSKIWVPAGESRAIYLSFPRAADMYHTNGHREGDMCARCQNGDVMIFEGVGKGPNFGATHRPRIANVRLHYGHSRSNMPQTQRSGTDKVLETTFEHDNQASGIMFGVKSLKFVRVRTFSVHADETHPVTVKVYHKEGTHVGDENNMAAWGSPMCEATINGAGRGRRTNIPAANCSPVDLLAGTTNAFYIYFDQPASASRAMKMLYSFGTKTGIKQTPGSSGDLEVHQGCGKGQDFSNTYCPRLFNGVIHYTVL